MSNTTQEEFPPLPPVAYISGNGDGINHQYTSSGGHAAARVHARRLAPRAGLGRRKGAHMRKGQTK